MTGGSIHVLKKFRKRFPKGVTSSHHPTPSTESALNTRRPEPSMVPFSSAVDEPPPAYRRNLLGLRPLCLSKNFDVVFLIDDSGSMTGRNWMEASAALEKNFPICTAHDADGIDLYFLNHTGLYNNVRNADRVQDILQNVQPYGLTPTGQRLYDILRKYLRSYKEAPDDTKPKPINIIVITDGSPTDDVKSPIIGAAKELNHIGAPPWHIGIQFFQVENDPGARKALKLLDDGLADVARQSDLRDIVDTVPFKGEGGEELSADRILKVVLGSVNRRLDRSSEGLHQSP